MVKTEVLAVGRELLIGKTINTNAHWIGGRLSKVGGRLDRITVVDDDLGEISSAAKEALRRRPDFLILVGGLGPTPDDMTLKGIAIALNRRLVLNRDALEMVRNHYVEIGRGEVQLTAERRKMARLPEGANPLYNRVGTAPGVRMTVGGTIVYSLPGVPTEMKFIFRTSVLPEIRKKLGTLYSRTVVLNLEGVFESALAPIIRSLMLEYPSAYIKSHPKGVREGRSRIELDIVAVSKRRETASRLADAIGLKFQSRIDSAGGTVRSIKAYNR